MNAIVSAANVWPEDPNAPWRVPEVYFMGVPTGMFRNSVLSAEPRAYPDVYVDIGDVVERKIKALDKIKSQQYAGPYARKCTEAVDGHFGMFMRVAYAEGFIRHRPRIYDYLPTSRYALERANEPETSLHARMDVLLAHKVPYAS